MPTLIGPLWSAEVGSFLQARSESMRQIFDRVRMVAPTKTTVLVTGETGAGKGLVARLIHHLSNRNDRPFVSVHCGAIPDTLLESELFGHEKGSFTGAVRRRAGKFELASGGTLLLDEVGTITPSAQVKLLNVLQERTIQRLGSEQELAVDVRLIAATNSDLRAMVDQQSFRSDLYYRLNVFPIEIPPLRDRREDIPGIVEHILKRLNEIHAKDIRTVHGEVIRSFVDYAWPGNVRELQNVLERAYILETSSEVSPDSIPLEILNAKETYAAIPIDSSRSLAAVRRAAVEHAERCYLKELLAAHRGRIGESAAAAAITPRQLHNLLRRHRIRKEEYKPPRGAHLPGAADRDG